MTANPIKFQLWNDGDSWHYFVFFINVQNYDSVKNNLLHINEGSTKFSVTWVGFII